MGKSQSKAGRKFGHVREERDTKGGKLARGWGIWPLWRIAKAGNARSQSGFRARRAVLDRDAICGFDPASGSGGKIDVGRGLGIAQGLT